MNTYIPPVVKNLLIINVLFYIAMWALPSLDLTNVLGAFYFNSQTFAVWQPVTYMFMHSQTTIMHILFNMFAVYSFGSVLESQWGGKRFINFYLLSGLGALALQWGVQAYEVYSITGSAFFPGGLGEKEINEMYRAGMFTYDQGVTLLGIYSAPMVGASGAVFGLLIAFAMMYPNAEMYLMFIPVPVKAKFIIPVYILIELSLGVAKLPGDSIAHYAHLGGALVGFILVKLWKKKDRFYDYYE